MRVKKKITCPYCGCGSVVRNGKANGVPRCKCKRCKHNFPTQRHEDGNTFYNSSVKKDAIITYLSGQNLKKYSEVHGVPRALIYYWVKQFKKRIFYKLGVIHNIKMTPPQKDEYKILSKRKLRRLRDLYKETKSKAKIQPYKEMLEFLAENYDFLPTKQDKIAEEELERILNQDPDNPDYFLGGIQGLYFPLGEKF